MPPGILVKWVMLQVVCLVFYQCLSYLSMYKFIATTQNYVVFWGSWNFDPQNGNIQVKRAIYSRWWQLKYVLFLPLTLGKESNLTSIFQMGWNHQPVFHKLPRYLTFRPYFSGCFFGRELDLHGVFFWKLHRPRFTEESSQSYRMGMQMVTRRSHWILLV